MTPALPKPIAVGRQLTDDHVRFRDRLCRFLHETLTPEVRETHRDDTQQDGWSREYCREFKRALAHEGFIGYAWPSEHGGADGDLLHDHLLADELEYHAAPATTEPSLTYVPHAILRNGTDRQKAELLPGLRAGELYVFLGYSEPEAGSDLANISCLALRDGNDYLITGQKSYSSRADRADYGLVIARTDPTSERHRGLTLFLVDMTLPGITVAQHPTVAGFLHPSVHFDAVRVPQAAIVGSLGGGWSVLMDAIDFERAGASCPGQCERHLDALCETEVDSDRLVTLAIETTAAREYARMVVGAQIRGERVQHETSVALLMKRETARAAQSAAFELLGPQAVLAAGAEGTVAHGDFERAYRQDMSFSFAAGGFDIVRDVIARRGLGFVR
jgi:alkylation response protein AidB-like acyl-CoA dehydrogenase